MELAMGQAITVEDIWSIMEDTASTDTACIMDLVYITVTALECIADMGIFTDITADLGGADHA